MHLSWPWPRSMSFVINMMIFIKLFYCYSFVQNLIFSQEHTIVGRPDATHAPVSMKIDHMFQYRRKWLIKDSNLGGTWAWCENYPEKSFQVPEAEKFGKVFLTSSKRVRNDFGRVSERFLNLVFVTISDFWRGFLDATLRFLKGLQRCF